MLEMLPTGPVWPALMWATSRWVDGRTCQVDVVELGGVEFEPFQDLVCRCEGVKVGWRSPTVDWATEDGCGGKLRGVWVGVFSVRA